MDHESAVCHHIRWTWKSSALKIRMLYQVCLPSPYVYARDTHMKKSTLAALTDLAGGVPPRYECRWCFFFARDEKLWEITVSAKQVNGKSPYKARRVNERRRSIDFDSCFQHTSRLDIPNLTSLDQPAGRFIWVVGYLCENLKFIVFLTPSKPLLSWTTAEWMEEFVLSHFF